MSRLKPIYFDNAWSITRSMSPLSLRLCCCLPTVRERLAALVKHPLSDRTRDLGRSSPPARGTHRRFTGQLFRSTSKSDSRSASCRIGACVQRAQSNDRAWSTRVVRDRSVTNLRVGALGASFDLRNNAASRYGCRCRPHWCWRYGAPLMRALSTSSWKWKR